MLQVSLRYVFKTIAEKKKHTAKNIKRTWFDDTIGQLVVFI